jgi:complex III assembly factor LYRM7
MSAALTAYRALIRSARLAFHEDSQVLTAALASTRAGFEENRFATATEAEAQIKHAHEVATFLRQNLVQGKLDEESGKYSAVFPFHPPIPHRSGGADTLHRVKDP